MQLTPDKEKKNRMMQRELKSKTKIYAIAAVAIAIVLVGAIYTVTSPTVMYTISGVSAMKNFASVDELRNYLTTNTQGDSGYFTGGPLDNSRETSLGIVPAPAVGSYGVTGPTGVQATIGSESKDYSTTNVQVSGVDEADTVKTDGQYIYTLNVNYTTEPSNNIEIVKADSQDPSVVGKIAFNSSTNLAGMYLSQSGNKLAVLGSNYNYYYLPIAIDGRSIGIAYDYYANSVKTFIYVYDVSNKADPVLTKNLTLSGSYFNSRMIGSYVYTVVSQPAYLTNDSLILPQVSTGGTTKEIAPTSIYYSDMQDNFFTYTTFAGVNILDDSQTPTDLTVLMGGTSNMYVSSSNIYVTYPNNTGESTEIYRVAINGANLSFDAKGVVPGTVLNQYSMDEYNSYFRVATTVYTGSWIDRNEHNNLYVLNMDLNVVGQIENLAQGERIYSARFTGDKAYLVTFKQTDPFFVLDLKDPAAPKVAGELKIPGYSSYLHPYDENHVIGIGKENQSVKISLFDVSDMNNPTEIAKYTVGENSRNAYSDSIALYEPKAFLFDPQKQLLVIPVSIYDFGNPTPMTPEPSQSGDAAPGKSDGSTTSVTMSQPTYWQGAYVFKVSPTGGFTLQGNVTHKEDTNSQLWGYYGNDEITRSLYIGNTLYTISNSRVQLNSLDDLGLIAKVNF